MGGVFSKNAEGKGGAYDAYIEGGDLLRVEKLESDREHLTNTFGGRDHNSIRCKGVLVSACASVP